MQWALEGEHANDAGWPRKKKVLFRLFTSHIAIVWCKATRLLRPLQKAHGMAPVCTPPSPERRWHHARVANPCCLSPDPPVRLEAVDAAWVGHAKRFLHALLPSTPDRCYRAVPNAGRGVGRVTPALPPTWVRRCCRGNISPPIRNYSYYRTTVDVRQHVSDNGIPTPWLTIFIFSPSERSFPPNPARHNPAPTARDPEQPDSVHPKGNDTPNGMNKLDKRHPLVNRVSFS